MAVLYTVPVETNSVSWKPFSAMWKCLKHRCATFIHLPQLIKQIQNNLQELNIKNKPITAIKLYDLFMPLFSCNMLERGTSDCYFQSVHNKHNFRKFFSESQKQQAARTWASGKFTEHVEEAARIHSNKEGYTQGPPCDSVRWPLKSLSGIILNFLLPKSLKMTLIKKDQLCYLWHVL